MSTVMQGFPASKQDQVTLANWRLAPYNQWAFHHVQEIVPSAEIPNNPRNIWSLEPEPNTLSSVDLEIAMEATAADAVVVLQSNKLVKEVYRNGMTSSSKHILFSVSKSILGLVAGALNETRKIKDDDQVTSYIPELAGTAYSGATIRDLLDMRAGVFFDEDYLKTEGPIIDYRYAGNWNPVPAGQEGGDLRSFMMKLTESFQDHGANFQYVSPNTDLLAWIFERATGTRYADLVSNLLWQPLGAEEAAYMTVDRIGGSRAAGGKCFTTRDLARVGMLVANDGRRGDNQIISKKWIDDIEHNGDIDAWKNGNLCAQFRTPNMHYRSKWYIERGENPLIYAWGIHGQFLFIDRARKISVAWFSSQSMPIDMEASKIIFSTVDKIRSALG